MDERGQLIVEVLLAIAIAFFFILGAAALTAVSLSASRNASTKLKAENIQQEAFEAVAIIRDTDWVTGFEDKTCTTAAPCRTEVSGSAWVLNTGGGESITLDGITYTRKVIISDVCREPDGDISASDPEAPCSVSGEFNDPLTKKVIVEVSWPQGASTANISTFAYLTRYNNAVVGRTNWVGGTSADCNGETDATKYCGNNGHINHSTAGEITIQ